MIVMLFANGLAAFAASHSTRRTHARSAHDTVRVSHLSPLDQFIKHALKAQRYVRYVDDFVLVHQSRAQLLAWHSQIERFLADTLRLKLKPGTKLKPLDVGIDFLGYIIKPTHRLVRRRVIHHAHQKLTAWAARHVAGGGITATPADHRAAAATLASYHGHMVHGRSWRLQQGIARRFPWTRQLRRSFDYRLEGKRITFTIKGNNP